MSHPPDDLDSQTLAHIAHARRLPGGADFAPPFATIGQLLARRAEDTPDKNFLTFYDEEGRADAYTYREFAQAARRVAGFLADTLGLTPGDRVATLLVNAPSTVLIYFGAWLLGVCVVPVNCGEDDERVQFILNNAGVKVVFLMSGQAERWERLRAGTPGVTGAFDVPLGAASGPSPRLPSACESLAPDTEALIVYTSGTTGAPKGVVLEQGNLLADARSIVDWHRFGPDDRAMNVLPLHHVNGIAVTLMTPLISGGSVVVNRKFRAGVFWKTLADEKCTWTSVVPTILAFLCERRDDLAQFDLSQFRHIICGAGPLTTELAGRFHDCYGVRVIHGYGLSETTCYSCFLPVGLDEAAYTHWMIRQGFPSIGCPLPVNAMAIHDSEGRALPPGQRGEIVIRGANVMRGYFARPEANRETFAHGWFRSGDEGFYQMGQDGRPYFFISGRLKELIIRGAVNYSPFDIDEVLGAIPGVKAAMAVGFENHFYGEEVGAYVQLESDSALTEQDILRACRQKLPYAKSPKVVVFGDTFPVTSTGKYQRLKLRPLFAAWEDAEFRESRTGLRAP